MPDRTQIEADILQFVRSRCPQYPALDPETDLLEEGLLDSLLLIDLIFQLEERYGIKLGSNHVSPANFRSVSAIVSLVQSQGVGA
ncbi:MAG: acyl carrier protein [Xanthobacteraceae bacterium]|nr:acyl carrier protein [Xanthobacteraceae bacterium]